MGPAVGEFKSSGLGAPGAAPKAHGQHRLDIAHEFKSLWEIARENVSASQLERIR
jgi:hypothetical protein